MTKEKGISVGRYKAEYNDILQTDIPLVKIYYSKGLKAHLINKKHFDCIKYIEKLEEIIKNPDYIGINEYEHGKSFEIVKVFEDTILVGIKFNETQNYLYVSTIYRVHPSKLARRLHSGKIKALKSY